MAGVVAMELDDHSKRFLTVLLDAFLEFASHVTAGDALRARTGITRSD